MNLLIFSFSFYEISSNFSLIARLLVLKLITSCRIRHERGSLRRPMPTIKPYRRSAIKEDRTVHQDYCDSENSEKRNRCLPSRCSVCEDDVLVFSTTCDSSPCCGILFETENCRALYNREVGSSLLAEEGENHDVIHYSAQRQEAREAQEGRMLAELHELLDAAQQDGSVVLTCPEENIGEVDLHQRLETVDISHEKDVQTTGTTGISSDDSDLSEDDTAPHRRGLDSQMRSSKAEVHPLGILTDLLRHAKEVTSV